MAGHLFDTNQWFTGNDNPLTQVYTCGSGTTVLVLGIVTAGSTLRAGGAPTFNGVALTQADTTRQSLAGDNKPSAELWYLLSPPTGSEYSISVPNTGSKTLYIQASSYKTADGSSSVLDVVGGDTGDSADPSVSVTTTGNGDVIVAVLCDDDGSEPSACSGTNLNMTDFGAASESNQYKLQTTAGAWASGWTCGSDGWGLCVAAFKKVPFTATLYDTITVTDSVTAIRTPLEVSLDDDITVVDAVEAHLTPLKAEPYESVTAVDAITIHLTPLKATPYDTVTVIDSVTAEMTSPPGTRNWGTIWLDGEVGDHFRIKISQIYAAGLEDTPGFEIHGFLLAMKRAGKISL